MGWGRVLLAPKVHAWPADPSPIIQRHTWIPWPPLAHTLSAGKVRLYSGGGAVKGAGTIVTWARMYSLPVSGFTHLQALETDALMEGIVGEVCSGSRVAGGTGGSVAGGGRRATTGAAAPAASNAHVAERVGELPGAGCIGGVFGELIDGQRAGPKGHITRTLCGGGDACPCNARTAQLRPRPILHGGGRALGCRGALAAAPGRPADIFLDRARAVGLRSSWAGGGRA